MGRKVERVVIDGEQYEFTQLGGVEGVELFHDLRKLALPALGTLLSEGDLLARLSAPNASLDTVEADVMGKLLGVVFRLFESMPKQLERDLREAFARNCKVGMRAEGQHGAQVALVPFNDASTTNGVFDQHFAGQPGRYQKWLLHGLKFNFASFLGGSGSFGGPANPPTPSP